MIFVGPITLLVFLLIVFFAILFRFSPEQLLPFFRHRNSSLILGFALFTVLLVVHLFSAQPWLADVLKVMVGALLGLGTAEVSKPKPVASSEGGVSAEGAVFGDNAEVAGRDINKTIERMQNDIAHFKDAVVNQYQTIHAIANSLGGAAADNDYIVNTIYERGVQEVATGMKKVIARWTSEGWRLRFFSSDYQGMDGITLVFSRASRGGRPEFYYQHGSSNLRLEAV
jgi:hypothetical protein